MIPVKRYTADGAPRPILYPSAIRNEAEGSPAIRNEAGGMGPTNTYIETGDWASPFVSMHGKKAQGLAKSLASRRPRFDEGVLVVRKL